MPFRAAPALGLVAVAASLIWAGPAAAEHPSPSLPGLSQSQVLAFEKKVLGARHAEEHARLRSHSSNPAGRPRFGGALNTGPLSGEDGSYRDSLFLAADVQAAADDPRATTGAWSTPFDLPMFAIHAATLPTGKVIFYGPPVNGFSTSTTWGVIWDPVTGNVKRVDPPANIYCSGQAFLADGQLLIAGGELSRSGGIKGLNKIFTFDPFAETWTEQPSMAHGRWYPSQVLLPDGRQVIIQGSDETGPDSINPTIEVFNPPATRGGQGTLTMLEDQIGTAGNPKLGDLYPNLRVMPSGRTLVAGPDENDSWYMDSPTGDQLSWDEIADPSRRRLYGNAVLEPPPPAELEASDRVVQLGGRVSASTSNHGSTATSEYFDESEAGDGWQAGASYNLARTYQNTVLLPDASMVSIGGGVGWPEFTGNAALRQVELWDPVTRTWRLGAAQAETRAYHSVAVLLPDGRVISAGDNGNAPASGATDSAEIYEPPYLFKGPRPTITSAPATIDWGDEFSVSTPDTDIDRAVLIAPGATTHATDMHQRYVPLELQQQSGGVDLTAPANANVAPPGYYMLFLVNSAGVPSVAKYVRIVPGAASGRITIEKQTNPADTADPKTSFSFTSNSTLGNFSLTDNETRAGNVAPGTYTVTEGPSATHELSSIECDDGDSTVSNRTATIRVAAGEDVECVFTNDRLPPQPPCDAPAITGTSPPSPANDNNPEIRGTLTGCGAAEFATTVDVYSNGGCTGSPTASGTVAEFTGAGITIGVANNSVTTLSARAVNVNGASDCSNSISYTESTPPPQGGNGNGGGPGGPIAGEPDDTPPRAKLAGRSIQKAGTRVGITVVATTESLRATAVGTVSVPGASRVYRLKAVRNRLVRRGTRVTLRLAVPKKARKAIRAYLLKRPSKRVKVRIALSVRDAAGNVARYRRAIKLRR